MVIQVCQGFSCASAQSSWGYTVKNKGCARQWLETGHRKVVEVFWGSPRYTLLLPLYVTGQGVWTGGLFSPVSRSQPLSSDQNPGPCSLGQFSFSLPHPFPSPLTVFVPVSFLFSTKLNCHRLDKTKTVLTDSFWSSSHNVCKEIPSFNLVPFSDFLVVTTVFQVP